jgi:hypothetical protein
MFSGQQSLRLAKWYEANVLGFALARSPSLATSTMTQSCTSTCLQSIVGVTISSPLAPTDVFFPFRCCPPSSVINALNSQNACSCHAQLSPTRHVLPASFELLGYDTRRYRAFIECPSRTISGIPDLRCPSSYLTACMRRHCHHRRTAATSARRLG